MKRWQFWLGVLVSAYFLYSVLREVNLTALWREILAANYTWIIPGVAVYFVAVWVRTWRWHYLLRPLKNISTRAMFPIVCIGYAGNNIFPARAGEVVRAVVLRRKEGVPVSASLATVIVERIYDGVVMLAFVFINLPELARHNANIQIFGRFNIQQVAVGGAVIFIAALIAFLLAAMYPHATERILAWFVGRFLPQKWQVKVLDLAKRFLGGLEALRSPYEALMIFATSVIIWLLETVKYWFVMHAFNFEVSFFTLMLMNGVVNLTTTIPSAPGYLGTFDLPGIKTLEAYSVPSAVAQSYTFVLHFALWLPITALGLFYMAREGINWNATVAEAKESESAA